MSAYAEADAGSCVAGSVGVHKVEPQDAGVAGILARVERPVAGGEYDGFWIPLLGWALLRNGRPITLQASAGRSMLRRFPTTTPRPDVRAHFSDVENIERPGFSVAQSVLRLPREFELVLSAAADGEQVPLAVINGTRRAVHPLFDPPAVVPLPVTTLGRTGSTLLVSLLGEHPEVHAFQPDAYDSRPFGYWLDAATALSEPASRLALVDSRPDGGAWWLSQEPLAARTLDALDDPVRALLQDGGVDDLLQMAINQAASFAQKLARAQGAVTTRYAAEKSWPNYVPRLLHELCPQTHEIILVRDFRDVLASILAFNAKRGYAAFGREHATSDEEFVDRFAGDVNGLFDAWIERRQHAFLIRYEDLIADPYGVLDELFGYLGISRTEEEIAGIISRTASRLGRTIVEHKTSASVAESLGRWRRDLPEALANRCLETFGEALQQFGYV